MKIRVLDSWPILEWLGANDPAGAFVMRLLNEAERGDGQLLMDVVNVAEVYCFLRKNQRGQLAESWRTMYTSLPVTIEAPDSEEVWSAANLKAKFSISHAGSFAAALALKMDCPVVTGDPALRSIDGLTVEWIGPQS